jgi:hypothetical protein
LGICYIRHACGDPPAGYELEIIWHEHDVGEYAAIGVTWEGYGHAPWEYISRAEIALSRFDNAVAWSELAPEPEEAKTEISLDEAEDVSNEEDDSDNDASRSIAQQTLLRPADHARRSLELYRRDEMIEADQRDNPAEEDSRHEFYLMCDDLKAEIAALGSKGVKCSEVQEARWGSPGRPRTMPPATHRRRSTARRSG